MAQDSDYELITEHLGYPPVALLDDIINTVNVLADRALDSVEQLLLSIPPSKLGFRKPKDKANGDASAPEKPEDAARREIESGTHQLETLLTAAIDRNFDKLELYAMQNILTVQPVDLRAHMRLAHYQDLDISDPSPDDDRPTLESITALRRRVQASQRLNLSLQRETARNEALLSSLRRVAGRPGDADPPSPAAIKSETAAEQQQQPGPLSLFNDGPASTLLSSVGSAAPVTTTTEFALSQLTSLRALSDSLRALMPELADADAAAATDSSSWRHQRAEYVEQSSRKYLERSAGLELGPQGEVRDGDYQGKGGNLAREDVEGLERVVGILGKTTRPPPRAQEHHQEEEDEAMDED